jgi:hypothetical protein
MVNNSKPSCVLGNMGRMSFVKVLVLLAFSFSITPALASAAANQTTEIGSGANTSRNWSGYAATGGTFTGVSGSWTVPSVVAASENAAADAIWVGVGGISSNDLIQIGTQAIAQNGIVSYEAWYELLPATSIPISITVHAGDSMTASLVQNQSNEWQISIRDNTNGQSFATTISYGSSLSSAEWIEEMPSDQTGYIPLDNFSVVSFTNVSAIENGNSVTSTQANAFPLTMITNANQVLAMPSSLGTNGAFTVSRSSTAATVAPHTVRLDGRGGFRRGGSGVSAARDTSRMRTFSIRAIHLY